MTSKVYFLRDGQFIKIGMSRDPLARIKTLQSGNPRPIEIVHIWDCYEDCGLEAHTAERTLHLNLKDVRQCGEWFIYDGNDFSDLILAVSAQIEDMASMAISAAEPKPIAVKEKRPRGRPSTGFDKVAYQREYMRQRRKKVLQ